MEMLNKRYLVDIVTSTLQRTDSRLGSVRRSSKCFLSTLACLLKLENIKEIFSIKYAYFKITIDM